jgi:hypothetical protein
MDESQLANAKESITSNAHEVYALSVDELDGVFATEAKARTKRPQETAWKALRSKLESSANYMATGKDLATLTKLFADLGFAGTKAYIKHYRGKPYVVFKGQAGLRKIFTGTRYGLQNAKVIQMGIGKQGAIHSMKIGGVLTVVLVSAFRIADYILTDQMTLNQLIGTLATDVVKIGIATGASIAAAVGAAAVFTVAIGPIVAAIGVGLLVSYGLSKLDDRYFITEKVIAALDEVEREAVAGMKRLEKGVLDAAGKVVESAVDYTIAEARRLVIDTAKHHLYRNVPRW